MLENADFFDQGSGIRGRGIELVRTVIVVVVAWGKKSGSGCRIKVLASCRGGVMVVQNFFA